MKETGILSLVLAVALVALSIGSMFGQGNVKQESNQNSTIMEESVYNNIMTRASVRKYQDKAVESEKIEKLLRAGTVYAVDVARDAFVEFKRDQKQFHRGYRQAAAEKHRRYCAQCGDGGTRAAGDCGMRQYG